MKELSSPNVNLKRLYEQETKSAEPILVIISPGADPSQELQELANNTIGHDRYHQVKSMKEIVVFCSRLYTVLKTYFPYN